MWREVGERAGFRSRERDSIRERERKGQRRECER